MKMLLFKWDTVGRKCVSAQKVALLSCIHLPL